MARPFETPVLGDIEDLGQPRILVAAQRRVDHVIGDDPRFRGVVADAAQCAFGMLARLSDAQTDTIARHSIQLPGDDIQRAQRRNGIGNGLSHHHPPEGLIDGEAGRAATDAIRVFGSVGDEVEAELSIASLDLEVGLADRRLNAVHDELEVIDQ